MAHSAPAASASHRSCRRRPPSPTPSRTRPVSGSPSFRSRPSGSRWRSRPRPELLAPERAGEVTAGGLAAGTPELRVAGQEVATCGSQPHAATGSGAGPALDEVEASRLLELLQIAPRVAIGHAELDGGLPQRPSLVDQAQELRPAGAELQLSAEDHPHPNLGLHVISTDSSRRAALAFARAAA